MSCELSGAVSTLTGSWGRAAIWAGSVGYGLKNFLMGPNAFGTAPIGSALFNLGLTAVGLPMMLEGVHAMAERHYLQECSDSSVAAFARKYMS